MSLRANAFKTEVVNGLMLSIIHRIIQNNSLSIWSSHEKEILSESNGSLNFVQIRYVIWPCWSRAFRCWMGYCLATGCYSEGTSPTANSQKHFSPREHSQSLNSWAEGPLLAHKELFWSALICIGSRRASLCCPPCFTHTLSPQTLPRRSISKWCPRVLLRKGTTWPSNAQQTETLHPLATTSTST